MNLNTTNDILAPYAELVMAAYHDSDTKHLALVALTSAIGLNFILSLNIFSFILIALAGGMLWAMYFLPTLGAYGMLALLLMYVSYAWWVFREWESSFAGHRLTRRNEDCPSNKEMPDIKK